MKREHLEYLWEQCDDGCLGPPFQPVPKKVWRDLLAEHIVSDGFEPDDVYPFDEDNEYGNIGRRCFYRDGIWQVSGFSPDELITLQLDGKIRIHSVELQALASHTAEQWGIRPVFWELEIEHCIVAYIIGWKGQDTAVVITDFGGKHGSLSGYLWEIRGVVREELKVMNKEGVFEEPGEEDNGEPDQPCPSVCKYLYVISIGSSFSRSAETQEQLDRSRITCLGTQDFLTDEGLPIWDARVKPRTILSYSDATKEFICDGEPLVLRPKETAILKVLWQNGDKITGNEELYEAVWPRGRRAKPRRGAKRRSKPAWPEATLYTHISALRKKLKGTNKLSIVRERGKGYRLIIHQ